MRRERYDVSINTYPQSRMEYRAIARFINAPTRFSPDYDNVSVINRLLINRFIPQDYERRQCREQLGLPREPRGRTGCPARL